MTIKNTFGHKIFGNLLTMLADKNFRDEVIAIREKFGISDGGINDEYRKKHGKYAGGDCFMELEKLRVKYKLNQLYGIYLMNIVLFAKIPDEQSLNYSLPFELFYHHENSGLKCAAIKIYPETSITDIQNNWPTIQKFSQETYGYKVKHQKVSKNYLRDLYIRALKRWGAKNKETIQTINKLFPQLSTLGYEDIPKIINKNSKRAAVLLKRDNKNQ